MEPSIKKKVLFTSHVANFQKFNRPFMRMLKEQGYEVHYASMGEEKILDADKAFVVPFTRSPFKFSNVRAYKRLKEIIDREKYDIIHTHTPVGSVVTRLAARAARKKGTRVIYTAHGFHFFKGAPLLNWLIYYPVEKWMAKYTDTLITINDEDFQRAKKKFKTDVRYVPGVGVDESRFKPHLTKARRNKLRASLGINPDDFAMIYPAELSKRKRQVWLLNCLGSFIKERPDVHLLLPGGDSLNGVCQKLASKLGIASRVHFLGYRQDIPQLMMASDLSISSSSQEGLPVNLLEALAAGLPIVATDSRGHGELINNGENGLLVGIRNMGMLAGAVESIYSDELLRKKMARNSTRKIKGYRFDDIAPIVLSIYQQKTKILHLLASSKFSGAESVACSIISETDSAYETAYCSPVGDIKDVLVDKDIRYVPISRLSLNEVRRVVSEFKPDIIHAHDFRASIIASHFNKVASIISHIHQNPAWINRLNILSVLYRIRSPLFSRIVVVTDTMRNKYIFTGACNTKVLVAKNSVDVQNIKAMGAEPYSKKFDLAFCGRLEAVKQPLDFLELVRACKTEHPDVKAVMIGQGSLLKPCLDYVRENDLGDNLEFVGFQRNPYKFLSASKLLVITSKDEGFGLVAVEAAVLGCMVVSYEIDSIKELLMGSAVTRRTKEELQSFLLAHMDDSVYVRRKAKSQQIVVLDQFDFERPGSERYYEGIKA